MKSTKIFLLLFTVCVPYSKANIADEKAPCMNIPHTVEVISCMIDLAESKKETYTKEYDLYLESINTKEERPYNKKLIYELAKEAKKNWDTYTEKECLAEAFVYEKGNYSFNDTYNSCLIKHYTQRIEYYKKNKF